MKKGLMTLVVAASTVGTLGGAARPGGAAAPASAVARCDGGRPARSDVHGLAVGAGIAGADGGAILRPSPAGTELIAPPDRGRGVVRHVASRTGVGTAYVRDRTGGDLVVSVTERGVRRYSTHAEASQPSLSARGDLVWAERSGLRLVGAGARGPRPIAGPIPGGMTFSPLFASTTTIVVGVAAPPTAAVPEDEYLSDLWRYDLRTSRWAGDPLLGRSRPLDDRPHAVPRVRRVDPVRPHERPSVGGRRAAVSALATPWERRAAAADPSGRDVPRGVRRVRPALEHPCGRDGRVADPAGARRREPRGCRLRRRHGRSARPHGSRYALEGQGARDRCDVAR